MYVIGELIARPRRDCDNTSMPGPSQPLTKTKLDKYHHVHIVIDVIPEGHPLLLLPRMNLEYNETREQTTQVVQGGERDNP